MQKLVVALIIVLPLSAMKREAGHRDQFPELTKRYCYGDNDEAVPTGNELAHLMQMMNGHNDFVDIKTMVAHAKNAIKASSLVGLTAFHGHEIPAPNQPNIGFPYKENDQEKYGYTSLIYKIYNNQNIIVKRSTAFALILAMHVSETPWACSFGANAIIRHLNNTYLNSPDHNDNTIYQAFIFGALEKNEAPLPLSFFNSDERESVNINIIVQDE